MSTENATGTSSTGTHRTQIIAGLLVIVVTFAVVGLMLLLHSVGLSLVILGTFVLALGLGARIVMMLGRLNPIAEAMITRCGYVATALGAMCFEPWDVRLWVGAVALTIMVLLDYVEYRVKGSRSL